MNKLLLGTTALVGASVLMAGVAYAAKPTLKINAYSKFEILGSSQDREEVGSISPNRGYSFETDSEFSITGDGVTDAGMKWRANIQIETDTNATGNTDEMWLRFSGSWGQINLGNEDGAEDLMSYHSGKAHGAGDGGMTDDHFEAADFNFINGRLAETAKIADDTSDATKATYFTPRIGGLQLGVSFTPDEGANGRAASADDAASGDFQNGWGLGVNYVKKHGGVSVAIAATGIFAEDEDEANEDLGAWMVGATIGYGNWKVGGAYVDNGDGGEPKNTSNDDSTSWNVGVGYSEGPVKLGLSYLHSEVEVPAGGDDEGDMVLVSATYSLGGGATVYADVFWFDTDAAGSDPDNDGVGTLLGVAVKF